MASPQGTTGSTMPRRRLGRQLRDLCNRAGMTTRLAARELEWSEAKIWRIETGQTSLRSLDVQAMCKIYGAPAELTEPLAALAKETKARGWWTAYSDAIAEGFEVYIGLEEAASRLSTFEDALIPGLLQTEGYTRALLAAARPELSADEIDRRVQVRVARQARVTRVDVPLQLDVVIGESLLGCRVGGGTVIAGQLDRLRELCELPNVRIRLVPTDSGYHDGLDSGRFVMLEFAEPGAPDLPEPPMVYVEAFTGPVYLDKEHQIDCYRKAFANLESISMDARASIDEARRNV